MDQNLLIFSLHTEDYELGSVSFLHRGHPKLIRSNTGNNFR